VKVDLPRADRYLQYLALTLGDARETTPSISRTLNPEWNQTLELPITGPQSILLEVVCWDKDRFKKDYMGEFDIPVDDIFENGAVSQEVRIGCHHIIHMSNASDLA
jgi:phosphatidylserine decarboxylase